MKTKTVATAALIAILFAGVATAAFASTGQLASTSQSQNQGDDHGQGNGQGLGHDRDQGNFAACNNLTVGEALTVSSPAGRYFNAINRQIGGNASGTFTFTVAAKYVEGCTLTISSGSFKLGSTTYTVTGGSIILNHGGRFGEGTGTTSGGSFLISIAGLQGNSKSASIGAVRLDFKTGQNEFLVQLHSPALPDDEAAESD